MNNNNSLDPQLLSAVLAQAVSPGNNSAINESLERLIAKNERERGQGVSAKGTHASPATLAAIPMPRATGEVPADGPEPPDVFNHNGVSYDGFTGKPFLAVQFLWTRRNKSADRQDLALPVWGDHSFDPDDNAVEGLRREINKFFGLHQIPWHAKQIREYLCLKPGLPRQR